MGQALRFLIIFIGIGVVLMVLRQTLAGRRKTEMPTPTATQMVQCVRCGVHVLESEALFEANQAYCSREHRDAGP